MTEHRLHNTVYARLEAIAASENITRVELGHLSRELLTYVVDTHDIDIVNRLLGVVTAMNRRGLILYFTHFLPHTVEADKDGTFNRFGKMFEGAKKIKRKVDLITEWLSDEANNFWVWSDANIEMKPKDFAKGIENAIKKALKGDEKTDTAPLPIADVIAAIFSGGVSLDDMLLACLSKDEERRQAEAHLAAEEEAARAAA